MNAIDHAASYLDHGWTPVPVLPRSKKPGWGGLPQLAWEKLRLTHADLPRYFAEDANVGVNLGEASHGLADVDVDCPEALALAPRFMLATWKFGRASKPLSHWLYLAPGAVTRQFKDPSGKTVVELRATPERNVGKNLGGSQTVMPGSVHPSGEPIEWSCDEGEGAERPVTIAAAELLRRVARLAEASLILRHAGRDTLEEWLGGAAYPELPREALDRIADWRGVQTFAHDPRRPRLPDRLPERIAAGGRNVALTKLAGTLRRAGLSESELAAALLEANRLRCDPPLAERDVLTIARSVSRYPVGGGRSA